MSGIPISLKETLDALYDARSQEHLANDPISFCYSYSAPEDREVAALVSSVFAYGSVKVIKGSLGKIFNSMGDSPARFVDSFDPGSQRALFAGFRHRFNNEEDLCSLLWAIRLIREKSGSIEQFFIDSGGQQGVPLEQAMNSFSKAVLALDYRPVSAKPALSDNSAFRFLFPSPAGGSSCKRLCMFLRWVARSADGIDLGLWSRISPSQLFIPVDIHISRIARCLGLTTRRTADWRMTREITASLAAFDPLDPVKYDFSICHLGISEGCDGRAGKACNGCPISRYCSACCG